MTPILRRELADYIHELADTHRHTEHYTIRTGDEWAGRDHRVTVPALVHQLADNDLPSATAEEGARPGYASKPAARLEAVDTLTWIDREAARWIRLLGHDDPGDELEILTRTPALPGPACRHCDHRSCVRIRRGEVVERRAVPGSGTTACLRLLHSLAVSAEAQTKAAITADVRRWWIRARIATGWDSAAWTPDNTCPVCSERGTLQVRLADQIAMCTNDTCRVLWDRETIGLLADHIRVESNAERLPKTGPGPCWCPVPKAIVADLSRLCPGCGSARCRHALGARLLDTIRASA